VVQNPSLGQRLRELRKARNIDQRTLAERVASRLRAAEEGRGFDFTYLSKIENDRVDPPSQVVLLQLAKELETDPDELLALAGKVPLGLGQTLRESEGARAFYRTARELDLNERDWKRLAEDLKRRKSRS
jgi:transcriptional regulator with XRE-family HTH domain